jgi:pimeloyl-ACP methyl ester carboxylesterase
MAQLLYLHGSGHTQESFSNQSAAFTGSDALSLPGHPGGQPLGSVDEYAAWLARYVDWKHAGRAVVAGNSLGGAIALRWALDFPQQAAGLVLIGTGARLRVSPQITELIADRWPGCIAQLADLSLAPNAPAEVRERLCAWHEAVGQKTTAADYAACDRFDVMGELAALSVPALVIVGELDRMTPPKYAAYLHEHIAGSQLAVVEGAGHLVMAEKPAEVNALIARFISQRT